MSRSVLLAIIPLVAVAVQQCPSTACTGDEVCCSDSTGWECCVTQSTYCVAPRGTFQTSTCCARWTVGCNVGSVGCCDPSRPWQFFSQAGNQTSVRRPNRLHFAASDGKEAPLIANDFVGQPQSGDFVGHALFAGGSFYSGLSVLSVDVGSGNVISNKKVSGPVKDYYDHFYGESWRVVPWDAAGKRFVFADQSYSSMGPRGKITVYTIDATTGSSTGVAVSGCTGYPLGMAWDAKQSLLVLGIHEGSQGHFCGVDPSTGKAKDLGSIARGGDESHQDYYAGFISHAHDNAVLRVGYKQVITGTGPTTIQTKLGSPKSTAWTAPLADSHSLPVSVNIHPKGGYIGLGPKSNGGLDVVSWDGPSGKSQLVASLGNAHIPQSMGMKFGYVADAVQGNTYAAVTVSLGGPLPIPGAQDKWQISTVDLKSGTVSSKPISPQPSVLGAETISLSGWGLAGGTPPSPAPPPAPPAPPTPPSPPTPPQPPAQGYACQKKEGKLQCVASPSSKGSLADCQQVCGGDSVVV